MYVKAHPFNYIKIQKPVGDRKRHFGESVVRTQVIRMSNGQIRTIKHYAVRSGSLI